LAALISVSSDAGRPSWTALRRLLQRSGAFSHRLLREGDARQESIGDKPGATAPGFI
jgi:hypothetical protein